MLEQLKADCLLARKARDTNKAVLLSTVISDIESVGKTQKREVNDEDVVSVLKKFLKGVTETLKVAPDHALAKEELSILNSYLPVAPTEEELVKRIDEIVSHGANTLGWVMKDLKFVYGTSLDGKVASALIRKKLDGIDNVTTK